MTNTDKFALLYRAKDFWYVASSALTVEELESKKGKLENIFGSKLELLTVEETLKKINVIQARINRPEIIFSISWVDINSLNKTNET